MIGCWSVSRRSIRGRCWGMGFGIGVGFAVFEGGNGVIWGAILR